MNKYLKEQWQHILLVITVFVQVITIAAWFGFNVFEVLALTTADVTVTATPEYLAMTNSEATWAVGAVAESTTKWWTAAGAAITEPMIDADGKSIATNTGSVASNIAIHTHNPTGGVGWTLSGTTVGENTVILAYGITGVANKAAMTKLVDTTPGELAHEVAAATGHVHWAMYLDTGTFTDGDEKTCTVTLTIAKHT